MVAEVSGAGLGLFGSSVSALGGAGASGNAGMGRGTDRVFVNTATGNLVVQSQDEVLSALGLDLSLIRTYNSQGLLDDDNADNWRLGVQQRVFGLTGTVNTANSTIKKTFGDGREVLYTYDASRSAYVSTEGDGAHDTLTYNTGTTQWTWTDGSARNAEVYNSAGQLLQSRDADLNTITYTYDASGRLTQIADASGQTTFLDYTGTSLNVDKIRVVSNGQTQTLTRYTYDASNRLTQVTVDLSPSDNAIADGQTYTTTYTYESTSKRIASITQKDGSSVAFTYQLIDGQYRVKTYTDAEGRLTTLTYTLPSSSGATSLPANSGVLSTTDTQTTTNTYNLNTGVLTPGSGGGSWAAAALLDTAGNVCRLEFDGTGNGMAVWVDSAAGTLVWSRYDKAANTWSAKASLGTWNTPFAPQLVVTAAGDAIVAWLDGSSILTVRRFTASAGTWSAATQFSSAQVQDGQFSVSISGSYAAVGWLESEGSGPENNFLRVSVWNGSSWVQRPGIATAGSGLAFLASVSVDPQGNLAYAWMQPDLTCFVNVYTASTATWGTAVQIAGFPDNVPKVLLGQNGNGIMAWSSGAQMLVRTYTRSTNTWSAPQEIDSRTSAVSYPTLALDDATGDAIVAWSQNDGTAESLYASRYTAAGGTWSAAQLLESSSAGVQAGFSASIRNGNAAVAWTQGSSLDLYAARYSAGAWSAPASLEASSSLVFGQEVAIDAQGNATVVFAQSGVRQARFTAGGQPYYLVPSAATWQSVANTLYGVNSAAAGTALQTALGNPALTAGAQLTNLPATLSVTTTTTITVPAYYTVQAGNTWSSITQTIYGSTDPNAIAALQAATGNPTLTTGLHLTVPLTLTYGGSGNTLYLQTDVLDALGFTTTYTQDSSGRLTSVLAPTMSGSRIETRYAYDSSGNVTTITQDPTGLNRITTLTYDANGNLLTSRDSAGNSTSRTYNANNQLLSETRYLVPDPDGAGSGQPTVPLTTRYAYDTENHLRFVISAQGRVTEHVYNGPGQRTATLKYTGGLYTATNFAESDLTTWANAQDRTRLERTNYAYDFRGNVLTLNAYLSTDSSGNGTGTPLLTQFVYDQRGLLLQTIEPPGSASTPNPSTPNLPYATTYTYDGLGRVLSTTQWVGGAVMAPVLNGGFETGTAAGWPSLPGVITAGTAHSGVYSARADSGAGGPNLITQSFAAAPGEVFRAEAYVMRDPANLPSATISIGIRAYDSSGAYVGSRITLQSASISVDGWQKLAGQFTVPAGAVAIAVDVGESSGTGYWFVDDVAITRPVTATLRQYDDATRRTITTDANGAITTSVYNRSGELISSLQGAAVGAAALSSMTYTYDADGRLRIVSDLTGVRQFYFYDEAGRKRGYVDGDGTLTEYVYDKANALIKTIQYAALVDSTTLASLVDGSGNPTAVTLATVRTAASGNPSQDRITRSVYDTAARLVYTIDESGAVTQYFYDGAGRVTDEVHYTNTVTIARTVDQLLPSDITITAASATDRRTRYFYDSDGNLAGKLDGEGYLVEYLYDPAGYLFQQIAYATQTNASFWLAGTLTQLRPAVDNTTSPTPERDINTYFFYDNQGRRIGTLDGEGYLTEFVYDPAGNLTQTNRWDKKLTYTAGVSTFATLKTAATAAPAPTVHTTAYQYDGAGRKTQETDYLGIITTYSYDSVGNLIGMTRAATTSEARTTNTNYDFLGRVLAELTTEGRAALDAISNPTQTQVTDIWNKYGVNYEYDTAGRRISATVRPNDAQTNKTVYYYDNDGRLRFEVNALGERKEYRYNALNQLTDELVYTTRISTTGLTGGLLTATLITTLTGSTNAQDALTTYTYTLTGQVASKRTVRTAVTAEDALVAYTYNAFGERRVRTDSIDASATLATDLTFDRRGLVTQTRWDQSGLNITEARTYDAFGRLKQITDGRLNIVKRFEYDTLGREVAHTESATSDRTITTYDAFSRVLTVRDALLNTTSYGYDDANKSMTLTTPEGVIVTTSFNRHGQTLTVVAAGNTTTYGYDLNGKLTSAVDTLGALETHTYDRGGRELTRVDARGTTITYAYDAANRVLTRTEDSATGGLALVTSYTYDGQGRVTRVDEPNGRRTDTTYYRDGRIDTVAVDPTALNLRTRYTYDRTGRVVTVTEGYGSTAPSKPRITQYIYDKLGRRIEEVVDPTALGGTLNLRTQYRYDKSNNLTRKIDARGFSTWYVYDTDNRVTHTIDALGGVTQATFDLEDRVIATRRYAASIPSATVAGFTDIVTTSNFTISTGTLDSASRSFFDRDGREKYTINAAGTVTERVFDANGQVTRTRVLISPALTGTYADAAAVTTALGSAATTINANDRISWTAYDLRGQAAYSVDGLGKVCRYIYDANGNVVSKTEFATQRSTTAAMDFAALNTAYGSATPAGLDRYTRYWYDATDRLRFTLDPEGYLTEQQYNDAGRLETTISYAAKPTVPAAATLAHLVARSNGVVIPTDVNVDQKTISAYDAAGRLSRVTDALNNYDEYTYDATGNKLTYRNKKGSIWDYQYDAAGRLTKEIAPLVAVATATETATAVTVAASTNVRLETVMVYDALGNVTSRTEAANTGNSRQTTYDYDALGRQTVTHFPVVNVYNTSGDTQLGNGAAIARTESASQPLYSEVAYDALGNTFRNRDLAGNYSFKIYDVLGRVEYEIDAEKYVTQYGYDVFGNKLTTKRYENALTAALPNNTTSLTSSALSGILVAGLDRTVTTGYDRLNRVTQVTQPSVSNFLPNNGSSGGPTVTAAAQTLTDYNAFGDVTRTRRLIDPASGGIYADTYFYYDRRGAKTAQVDPLKFLTIYEYDETGDLKRQLEYATALAGTVNFSGYGSPMVTTPATTPASAVGYDRETLYAYDRLNRKVSETRVGIEHATISGATVTMATGNQVTTYGYDVLGNQNRVTQVGVLVNGTATDLNSYTYYDVLGRVVAKVEPARNLGNGTIRTPLTVMRLDAYGNVLEQTEYANGAAGTPTEAAIPGAQLVDSTNDRTTRMALDQHGRVIHSEDAKGADRLASYNARGELVKEWQAVTNADSVVEYRTTLYTYDNLGRQLDVIEPQRYNGATTVSVTNRAKYNSFGEVIERGLVDGTATSGKQELFSYDVAGRLWRTNSGDGITKVYLHDLSGNVTAEIRSQGRNLADNATYANAAAVGALTSDVMRTETRYDVQGHVVEQRLPTFNTTSGLESIAATFTIGQVSGPANPEAVYQRIHTQTIDFYVVNPDAPLAQNGGYYLSASGQYVQDTTQTQITAARITWDAPTDASIEAKFEYRVAGSTDANAWASIPVGILTTNRLSANVSSLVNQLYEYRVSYRRRTETSAYAEATGTFQVNGTVSGGQTITPNPPDPASEVATLNVTQTGGMMVWAAPGDTTVVGTLRVRPTGGSSFTDITATRITGGNFQADARTALAVAGTYDYEIVYTRNGVTIAKKVGTLNSAGDTTPRTVTNSSIQDLTYIPPTDAVPTPTVQLGGSVGAQIISFESSDPGPRPQATSNPGNPKPITWDGQNEVRLNWANQGAGTYTVQVDYLTSSWDQWVWDSGPWDLRGFLPVAKTRPSAAATATGATITWQTADGPVGEGGISSVTAVRVFKNGSLLFNVSNPTAIYGRGLNWARPADTNVVPRFEYSVAGANAWTDAPVVTNPTTLSVDLNGLTPQGYDYRITYRIGGRLTAQQTGTLSVGASTLSISALSNVTNPAAAVPVTNSGDGFSWSYARQNGADSVKVTYWVDSTPQTIIANASTFALSFASITAGGQHTVTYVIEYLRPGETNAYGYATGILRFTVSYPTVNATFTINSQTAVYPSGLQAIAAPTDLGSNYIGWTTSAVAGATVVFRYQRAAGGAWTELAEEVNGGGFKVNLQSLISGLFNYEILYTRAGETNPYARGSGTLNVTRTATATTSAITPTAPGAPVQTPRTPTQRQTLDRWGNVIASIDAMSNTTNYRYNQYGQLIEAKQPQVAYKSTLNGQVVIGNATPITRNYYDRAGRLIAVQDANGNLTRATLNAAGQVITESHADGGSKGSTFDLFGELVTAVDELQFETRSTYDRVGNLTAVAREVTDNVFLTENYAYDEAARRISETNADNEITRYYYDLHDNLIRRRSHLNANTNYGYDANDRKIIETDAISGGMTWAYDYFGRMTGHTDLGGANYTYSYTGNFAGLLQQQTTQTGQNVAFVYDSAGHLTQINDTGTNIGRNVTYSYDAAGRRSREKTKINGLTYQDTFIQYDALNRMSRMTDLRYDLTYSYDLQGNRTNIVGNYYDHEKRLQTQDLWYSYDNMNRVLISQGVNAFNQIGTNTTQGVKLTYNAAGQRTSSETYGLMKYRHEELDIWDPAVSDLVHTEHDFLISDFTYENYEYDGLGRLTKTWRESEFYQKRTNSSGVVVQNTTTQTTTLLSNREYDNASRETKDTSVSIENDDLIARERATVYNDDGQLDTQTTRRQDPGMGWQTESIVHYTNDAANVLRSYVVDVYKTGPLSPGIQYKSTYNNLYRLGESYQDAGQNVSSQAQVGGVTVPTPGTTTRSYNVNGELISFTDSKDANKNRYFANGVGGQPLLVVQGNITNVPQAFADALARADNSQKSQHFFFANGQSVGSFCQLQDAGGKFKANFDVNYTAISDEYPSSVPVSVVAQENDTLRTIAARVFGDQNLWYVLAEENGLTDPDARIEEGTVIQVPNEVLSVSNASGSFKPFNVADAIGDTSPTQPAPPRPKKKGCGVLGQILMVVVAIVVTWFTAGATAGFFASLGPTAGGIATAATAAAAGSIASQGVGIAIGAQDSFSWKSVATAALTAGITQGIGLENFNLVNGSGNAAEFVNAAARGLAGNAIGQGVNIAVGLQKQFSWRDLAISAVSAPIANKVGERVGAYFEGRTSSAFATSVGSGLASAAVRMAFGGKVDAQTVLGDVFGNAIGNSIVEANTPIGITAEQWDEVDRQLSAGVALTEARVATLIAAENSRALSVNPEQPFFLRNAIFDPSMDGAQFRRVAQPGGHYYLPGLVGDPFVGARSATGAVFSKERLNRILEYSEWPDETRLVDGFTNGARYIQEELKYGEASDAAQIGKLYEESIHALNGRTVGENIRFFKELISNNLDNDAIIGIAMHGLVDSVFHAQLPDEGLTLEQLMQLPTYSGAAGHGAKFSEPDYITPSQVANATQLLMDAFQMVTGVPDLSFPITNGDPSVGSQVLANVDQALDTAYALGVSSGKQAEQNFRFSARLFLDPGTGVLDPRADLPNPIWGKNVLNNPITAESTYRETERFLQGRKDTPQFLAQGIDAVIEISNRYISKYDIPMAALSRARFGLTTPRQLPQYSPQQIREMMEDLKGHD